jgi:hypothetical protein
LEFLAVLLQGADHLNHKVETLQLFSQLLKSNGVVGNTAHRRGKILGE